MAFRKLKNGFYIEVTSKLQAYQQNFDFLDKNQNFEILFQNSIKKLVKKP